MQKLTDDEVKLLKDLWDRTIRPENKISIRTHLTLERVKECLKLLESKDLVLFREESGKWRITPEGEAFIESYIRSWYQRPFGIVLLGLIIAILGGAVAGLIVIFFTAYK